MEKLTPAQKAYADLAKFEKNTVPHDGTTIQFLADEVRKQFAAGGVKVDEELDARIKAAVVRSNRVSAETKLDRFEKNTVPHDGTTIQFLADEVRKQFAAGGIELTNQGKLPERLETRLVAATTKALEFSKR